MKFNPLMLFPTTLVLEALNVDQLVYDVKAVIQDPSKHCPACMITTGPKGHTSHTIYIEGTMILDIR